MATQTVRNPAGKPISRREFLFYIGSSSFALTAAAVCGGVTWFTQGNNPIDVLPRFEISMRVIDEIQGKPLNFYHDDYWGGFASRLYLVKIENHLLALSNICPHEGCIAKWEEGAMRYACPCHGDQFMIDGTHITGPSPRDLDRYVIEVKTPDGSRMTSPEGEPVSLESATSVVVYPTVLIPGKPVER